MIKSFLFSVSLFFFVPAALFSQNECGTPAPPPPSWIFNPSLRVQSTQTTQERSYMLRIFIHIIRKTDGSGGVGAGALTTIPNVLNSAFSNTGIQFHLSGHEYINSDQFYIELTDAEKSELFATNAHNDAIDIYVLGSSTNFSSAGSAQTIPSTAMIVHGNYYNQSTLPHEMGHCLGLYHTHHGTYEERDWDGSNPDPEQCKELVNGSNSTTCGDYIADTPADPYKWSANSCSYTGTARDVDDNNQRYNPDPSNLMSYAYKPCRNKFTPLQIQRMHDFIANTTALQNTIFPHISGTKVICSSSPTTFTIQNWPDTQTIEWTPGPYIIKTGSSNNQATCTAANGSGYSWIDAKVNGEQLARFTLWVGPPPNIQISGLSAVPPNEIVLYYLTSSMPYNSQINWTLTFHSTPVNYVLTEDIESAHLKFSGDCYVNLQARVTNQCGSTQNSMYITVAPIPGCPRCYLSYPNPVSNILNIEINQEVIAQAQASTTQKVNPTYDIRLYDGQGNQLRRTTTKGGSVQFNVANLTNGIYYLHIYDGVNEKPEMRQIVVEH